MSISGAQAVDAANVEAKLPAAATRSIGPVSSRVVLASMQPIYPVADEQSILGSTVEFS